MVSGVARRVEEVYRASGFLVEVLFVGQIHSSVGDWAKGK